MGIYNGRRGSRALVLDQAGGRCSEAYDRGSFGTNVALGSIKYARYDRVDPGPKPGVGVAAGAIYS